MAQNSSVKIVAIESSGSSCAVALANGPEILAEVRYETPNMHDRMLALNLQRLTQDCAWNMESIDCLAVSAGPGSFTGLRIGAALAKAICINGNPKLVAVPTADSLAQQAAPLARALGKDGVWVLINSHRDLVYAQQFNAEAESLNELQLVPKSALTQNFSAKMMYCGPAMPLAEIPEAPLYPAINRLSAAAVARVGATLFASGQTIAAELYEPLYAQEFQPKVSQKSL